MSAEEQVEVLRTLSVNVHNIYSELAACEAEYIDVIESHHIAKEKLMRAIDDEYDKGNVVGKNERERDAHLRRLLPDLHNDVARLDALARGAERRYRSMQRDAERLALQVQIARMVLDVEKERLPHAIHAPSGLAAEAHALFGTYTAAEAEK